MEHHDGQHVGGKWIVSFRAGDEEHTYVVPFEMVQNGYYLCYVLHEGAPLDWSTAKMAVMRFMEVRYVNGRIQPHYQLIEPMTMTPGEALVLPFKALGCQWPPHPGEDSWT